MKATDLEEDGPPVPAVGYVRVSSERQARHGKSMEAQKKMIAQYCGWSNLHLIGCVEEPGISAGKKINQRPGLMHVLDMVDDGDVEAVVVMKLDRMFRSVVDAAEVLDRLREKNVGFHSVVEHFDTSTPWGEASMQLVTVFAQMERKMGGERTKAVLHATKKVIAADLPPEASPAMRAHARNGKLLLGNAPYGYEFISARIREAKDAMDYEHVAELEVDKAKYGELVPAPQEMKIVNLIKRLSRQHGRKKTKKIAGLINASGYRTRRGMLWSAKQVYRTLKRGY